MQRYAGKSIFNSDGNQIIYIGKDMLFATKFDGSIVNKFLEIINLHRRTNAVSFWVTEMLVHDDDDFNYGSFINSFCCCNRNVINLIIFYAYDVNTEIRMDESSVDVFTFYSSILSMVD